MNYRRIPCKARAGCRFHAAIGRAQSFGFAPAVSGSLTLPV